MSEITQLRPNIYQFHGEKPNSHVYLLRGSNKNALIDTSTTSNFPSISKYLLETGLRTKDIHLIILTHEHSDHTGAASLFFNSAVICAHRLAANKIELLDDFVTMNRYLGTTDKQFHVHIWLEDNMLIDLGNQKLTIIHTPGHTSGCICIYEAEEGLLFSGDTVFANGALSDIAASGNISDYVNSLEKLRTMKISELYPGHGKISTTPEQDIKRAVGYAKNMMDESKILFEALAQKTGIPPLIKALYGKNLAKIKNEQDSRQSPT